MSRSLRSYRGTHAPGTELEPSLEGLERFIEAKSHGAHPHVDELARKVHLPVAAARGSLSSYADTDLNHRAVRVCAGTSCMLAGSGMLANQVAREHACEQVYCLGYCDRSPAAMTPSGRVLPGDRGNKLSALVNDIPLPHPAPPSIRNEARHAIVTERLLNPEVIEERCHSYAGLQAALDMQPAAVIEAVIQAGVRGRGGAAFPTGVKWRAAAAAQGSPKYIVANGDEGDPGSFVDREIMERDPHGVIEGMAIAAHAIGAREGIVFIRSEYPISVERMQRAIDIATIEGVLGPNALGRGKPFTMRVVRGLGSYVCGEETALLNAIEGMRGEVRPRPPFPVDAGLYGKPTVVDNVETLLLPGWILRHGVDAFRSMGTKESQGTKAICLDRGFARPGIVEVEFGITLRELIDRHGGGGTGGRELEAVLVGGPMGSIVPIEDWDVPVCFAAMREKRINLGHAGLVAIQKGADWGMLLRHLLTFMRDESCGKCVPCRLGTTQLHQIAADGVDRADLPSIERILDLMGTASLCAFGRETPGPIATILSRYRDRVLVTGRGEARS